MPYIQNVLFFFVLSLQVVHIKTLRAIQKTFHEPSYQEIFFFSPFNLQERKKKCFHVSEASDEEFTDKFCILPFQTARKVCSSVLASSIRTGS